MPELDDRAMGDVESVRSVLARYARGVDRGDRSALETVFLPAARCDYGGWFSGDGAGLIDWLLEAMGPLEAATHHMTTSTVVVRDDTAVSEQYCLATQRYRERGRINDNVVSVRYLDRLVRTGDGWRIADRRVAFDWVRNEVLDASTVGIPAGTTVGSRSSGDPSYEHLARA